MRGSKSGRQTFGKWSKGFPCELPGTDRQNEEKNKFKSRINEWQ